MAADENSASDTYIRLAASLCAISIFGFHTHFRRDIYDALPRTLTL